MKFYTELEEKPEEFNDPIVTLWYNSVKDKATKFTKKQEKQLGNLLYAYRVQLRQEMLKIPTVQEYLIEQVRFFRSRPGGSVAKLAEDYNAKIKGRNNKITRRILKAIKHDDFEHAQFKVELFEKMILDEIIKPDEIVSEIYKNIQDIETKFIHAGLKIATNIALRMGREVYGIDPKDLVQVANEKLLETVKRFKPDTGVRFVTYAHNCIESQLQKYIMNNSREVRIPEEKVDLILTILKANAEFSETPSISALTKVVNKLRQKKYIEPFTEVQVEESLSYLNSNPIPIEMSLGEGETKDRTIGDLLISEESTQEELLEKYKLINQTEDELLDSLSELEAAVIYFRFLDPYYLPRRNNIERPYSDIPEIFEQYRLPYQIDRTQVKKLETQALMKLRLDSEWFWNRLKDEVLGEILTSEELMVLFVQTIRPYLNGQERKSWVEVGEMININPRKVIKLARSARLKIRKHFADIEVWINEEDKNQRK